MIEAVVHRLCCDTCRHAWISPVADTPAQAREAVALNGWTSVNGVDRCPRCTRMVLAVGPPVGYNYDGDAVTGGTS